MKKIIDSIPVSNRILAGGGLATAVTAIITAWTQLGGGMPLTEHSEPVVELVDTVQSIQEDVIDHRIEQVEDKLEAYTGKMMPLEQKSARTQSEEEYLAYLRSSMRKYTLEAEELQEKKGQ